MNKKIKTLIGMVLGLSLFTASMAGVVGSCEPEEWGGLIWGCVACTESPEPPCDMAEARGAASQECTNDMGGECEMAGKIASCLSFSDSEFTCSSRCMDCRCQGGGSVPPPKENIWDGVGY